MFRSIFQVAAPGLSDSGSATEPSLLVAGRVDGEAYTVTAGARSLSITNSSAAVLETTVELASDGSSIAVTNGDQTNPSWTAPSGGGEGDAYLVRVTATKDGLTTSIAFTERIAANAAPTISISGRADGQAYTISSGVSRSLTITNNDGATLQTTVDLASDGSSVSVTDDTLTTPSWTAPIGGTFGEAVQVRVVATKDGLTSTISFTERVASSSYTALVAASDPADVSLSADTTSSSASARTFTEPTGGSGSYTLSVTKSHIDGSGTSLQGDNTTGYYVSSLQNGDAIEVIGKFTDDVTGQIVRNRFVITVAVPVYSEPTLSITGRVDGGAYTETAGSTRTLSITAEAGSTLSTTVQKASDGSTITVTDPATDSPSWTAPSGSTNGEAVQVLVTATKNGYTSSIAFTERMAGSNYTAMVAASDPADVSLSGGSTSSSASARTFTNPTGGSGSYTLAVTRAHIDGSGSTLQGDNSTGYYLDSLEEGDTVEIIGSFTDDSTGQVVQNRFVVTVAVTVYTEPSISVSGVVNGRAYTASPSTLQTLTITNTDSATLSTTVRRASDNGIVSVSGSATTTPSWTTDAATGVGESYQVLVTATKDGLSSTISYAVLVDAEPASPTLSVGGITNGEAYSVSPGTRTLAITAEAGSTLLTTVELASGTAITVSRSTLSNPTWTAPSGGEEGDAYQVLVTATKNGLTSTVAFTERMVGTPPAPTYDDLDFIEIDITDGTWTLYDPDGLVQSTSFDSATGTNTATFNAANSNNYQYAGTTYRAPRWYKLLQLGSTQVTTADWSQILYKIEPVSVTPTWNSRNVIGTTHNPTANSPNGIATNGGAWQKSNFIDRGVVGYSGTSFASNAQHSGYFLVTAIRGGDRIGVASSAGFNSSGAFITNKTSIPNQSTGTGSDLYIFLSFGQLSTGYPITSGDQISVKVSYFLSTFAGL